ncbi:hypothetical protein THAOC_36544 [Thalassiosira oceanica]|uniref:Uncharacterized protein n=1 Tax=Thalassiosira oceanica TaxID=159749 RepID=K0REC0_THAOC|nr:hypothetical protein THAOC_36544 [Thalassiosira oceanica]|eukprot:EJK44882.1 hypothetical protein THAOC_36544 [Thalassiosira oceanica]
MKLSTVSLLATASAANASLRGGTVVTSLNAALSAIPAIPAPAVFMASSIGEGDSTCGTETGQIYEDAGLNTALEECSACAPTTDGKTITFDYPSCDATADAIAACSSAGGMSYTIDIACSETSGSGGPFESIDYSGMPDCAGTSCTVSDFNTNAKEILERFFEKTTGQPGTWSCTATASFSNPSDEALLSVE